MTITVIIITVDILEENVILDLCYVHDYGYTSGKHPILSFFTYQR